MTRTKRQALCVLVLVPLALGAAFVYRNAESPGQPQSTRVAAMGLKPDVTGLINMGAAVPTSMVAPNPLTLGGAEVLTTWGLLQPNPPTASQAFDPREIERINKVILHTQSQGLRAKLRVWAGNNTPRLPGAPYEPSTPVWAMNLDGAPFYLNDYACAGGAPPGCSQPNGGSLTYEFPRWWTANFKAAYNAMETALGALYDGNRTIAEVSSPRCMTIWDEPMVRQYDAWSLANLLKVGYHTTPVDSTSDMQCQEDQLIAMKNAWPHTVVQFSVNPYFDITPPLPGKTAPKITRNDAEAQTLIAFCRTQLGNQCLLENEELGRATSNPSRPVAGTPACGKGSGPCFDAAFYNFLVGQGSPLGFMVDVPSNIDTTWPMSGILAQGVAWHANNIEVGGPWFDVHKYTRNTPGFFQPYNASLQTNPWGSYATGSSVTTLTSTSGTIAAGESLPVTVTTAVQASHAPSAGTVQLLDEATTPPVPMANPVAVGAGGVTKISVILPAGRHVFAALFRPTSQTLRTSVSSVLSFAVKRANPTEQLSTSNPTPKAGVAVTLTVTLSLPGGLVTPTGTVILTDINTHKTLGTVTLSGGRATLVTAFATKGKQTIKAVYSGDVNSFTGWASVNEAVA